MSDSVTMVLNGGGLRGLVATAMILSETRPQQICLLHLADHRSSSKPRLEHFRLQARHLNINRVVERQLPHLKAERDSSTTDDRAIAPLFRSRMVMNGLADAIQLKVGRLIWPVQFNADFNACAQTTEQVVLIQTLAQLELGTGSDEALPEIEMPLLELDDQQVIELGGQLDVPWELAWSCLLHGQTPCRVCDACRRRHAAFDTAGMVDPIDQPLIAR